MKVKLSVESFPAVFNVEGYIYFFFPGRFYYSKFFKFKKD